MTAGTRKRPYQNANLICGWEIKLFFFTLTCINLHELARARNYINVKKENIGFSLRDSVFLHFVAYIKA
jgi:hypothetical protein